MGIFFKKNTYINEITWFKFDIDFKAPTSNFVVAFFPFPTLPSLKGLNATLPPPLKRCALTVNQVSLLAKISSPWGSHRSLKGFSCFTLHFKCSGQTPCKAVTLSLQTTGLQWQCYHWIFTAKIFPCHLYNKTGLIQGTKFLNLDECRGIAPVALLRGELCWWSHSNFNQDTVKSANQISPVKFAHCCLHTGRKETAVMWEKWDLRLMCSSLFFT